jgi:copper transport protein
VIAPDGHRVDNGPVRGANPDSSAITVTLAADPHQGSYVVNWRATAADDGHTTTGAVVFAVGAPSRTSGAGNQATSDPLTSAVLDLAVWLGLAGLAALVGFAAIRSHCQPASAATAVQQPTAAADAHRLSAATEFRWPATVGWTALLVGSLLQLFAYGPATQGESLGHLADRDLLAATLPTHQGEMLAARILLLAVTAAASGPLLRRTATSTAAATVLTLLLALTWAETSHAADGSLVPLALLVTTLHVAAMAVWVGGLLTLAVLWHRAGPELAATTARFSRLALGAVTVLAATGLYQAFRELGSPAALTGTPYGRWLLAKTAVLLPVLAVAAVTRRRPALGGVLLELAGVSAVLVITVLLIGSAPAGR